VTCPRCGHTFRAEPPSGRRGADNVPAGPPTDRAPHLTAPHLCFACQKPIAQAFGRRHHTFTHEECLRRTDVFAAVYYCPCCTTRRTLLESPKRQWGQRTTCPNCASEFVVPDDEALREVDPRRSEGAWFAFACPACRGQLESNVRYSRSWVVCLHCRVAIQVPPHGEPAAPVGHHDADPTRQVVQPVGDYRCPFCGLRIPKACRHCPQCRQPL
jgi:hypothetical protein